LPLLLSKLKERKELEEEKRGDIKKPLNGNDVSKRYLLILKKKLTFYPLVESIRVFVKGVKGIYGTC
jgi:hypothetical protein